MADKKTTAKKTTTTKKEAKKEDFHSKVDEVIDKKPKVKKTTTAKKTETKERKAPAKTAQKKKPAEKKVTAPKKKEKPKEAAKPKEEPKKEEKKSKKTEIKAKKKPELDANIKDKLQKRKEIKKRTPEFLREEWFRYKRVPKNWRRPDGITSKMRRNFKYRPSKVRVGFRGPKDVRGLHASGFEEVVVNNVNDLENINPKTQAARIGGTVGTRKRTDIGKKAEELNIRVLNL
jgi:large subunit ribosomal protein L32e